MEAKLVQIGNSKGVRIPQKLIAKYRLQETLILQETDGGILIAADSAQATYSWEDTYKAMAAEAEDWSDLDIAVADGLNEGSGE